MGITYVYCPIVENASIENGPISGKTLQGSVADTILRRWVPLTSLRRECGKDICWTADPCTTVLTSYLREVHMTDQLVA